MKAKLLDAGVLWATLLGLCELNGTQQVVLAPVLHPLPHPSTTRQAGRKEATRRGTGKQINQGCCIQWVRKSMSCFINRGSLLPKLAQYEGTFMFHIKTFAPVFRESQGPEPRKQPAHTDIAKCPTRATVLSINL